MAGMEVTRNRDAVADEENTEWELTEMEYGRRPEDRPWYKKVSR